MIDPNGNSNTTSISSTASRKEAWRVAARASAALKSASTAHPYLVATGLIAILGLAVTGGLLAGSRRRRSFSDILTGWF